jgi:hypothetical protein
METTQNSTWTGTHSRGMPQGVRFVGHRGFGRILDRTLCGCEQGVAKVISAVQHAFRMGMSPGEMGAFLRDLHSTSSMGASVRDLPLLSH